MSLSSHSFWTWFRGFADQLPADTVPDELQDELLAQLHRYDDRLYFLVCTNSWPRELIITADGNGDAFASAESLVAGAPKLDGWKFIALKPAMGFDFRHTDGPISLDASTLWFKPITSPVAPSALGIIMAFPDADFVLENQSVDTAFTILESAIGERSCAEDIAYVEVDDLPKSPEDNGYLRLTQLPEYIEFHKRKQAGG